VAVVSAVVVGEALLVPSGAAKERRKKGRGVPGGDGRGGGLLLFCWEGAGGVDAFSSGSTLGKRGLSFRIKGAEGRSAGVTGGGIEFNLSTALGGTIGFITGEPREESAPFWGEREGGVRKKLRNSSLRYRKKRRPLSWEGGEGGGELVSLPGEAQQLRHTRRGVGVAEGGGGFLRVHKKGALLPAQGGKVGPGPKAEGEKDGCTCFKTENRGSLGRKKKPRKRGGAGPRHRLQRNHLPRT